MKKILILLFISGSLLAQSNAGKSFHFAVSRIPWEKESHVYVSIFSENVALGTLKCDAFNFEKRFALKPGDVTTIEIPRKILVDTNERVTNKSISVQSNSPVVVTVFNNQEYGSDAFLALPDENLGKEYMAMCYPGDLPSFLMLVSKENNTVVDIYPHPNKSELPHSIKLKKGEVYMYKSLPMGDLTGTYVKSSKPISMMSGNLGAFIPQSNFCCANHLVEMIPPIKQWGKLFFTAPLAMKKNGDVFKILACEDATTIYLDEDSITVLSRGQYYETVLPSNKGSMISSNRQILVAQFSTSSQFDSSSKTDPFMVLVQPYEQYQKNYSFIVPQKIVYEKNYINITIQNSGITSLRLNENILSKSDFTRINDLFSYGTIPIRPGGYRLYSNDNYPFGLNVYGYDNFDAYGYIAGTALGEHYCEKLTKERFLLGLVFSYPLSYGIKFELGYEKYGFLFSYLYFPEVGVLDDTPPPDYLSKENFSHSFLLSVNYTFPITCNFNAFLGPYFSVSKRTWENVIDDEHLKGSFFEYYFGAHGGAKFYITNHVILEAALSVGVQTTHRFSDEQFNGYEHCFYPVFVINYQIF
jgi:hypothetical protein